jgi:hypothetical protein
MKSFNRLVFAKRFSVNGLLAFISGHQCSLVVLKTNSHPRASAATVNKSEQPTGG